MLKTLNTSVFHNQRESQVYAVQLAHHPLREQWAAPEATSSSAVPWESLGNLPPPQSNPEY